MSAAPSLWTQSCNWRKNHLDAAILRRGGVTVGCRLPDLRIAVGSSGRSAPSVAQSPLTVNCDRPSGSGMSWTGIFYTFAIARITNRTLCGVRQVASLSPEAPVALRIKLVELNRPLLWGLYRVATCSSCAKVTASEWDGKEACWRQHGRIDAWHSDGKDSRDLRRRDWWLRRSRMSCGEDEASHHRYQELSRRRSSRFTCDGERFGPAIRYPRWQIGHSGSCGAGSY